MLHEAPRLIPIHDPRNFLDAQLPHLRNASKFAEQLLCGALPDARNVRERCPNARACAPLPMKSYGEAVRFIANLLDQMQDRRVRFENDWLILAPKHIKNFFLLG